MNYLYNGVEWPDINEVWTDELKKISPYAYISVIVIGGARLLMMLENPYHYVIETGITGDSYPVVECEKGKATWVQLQNGKWDTDNQGYNDDTAASFGVDVWHWASHDIIKEDGSVFLAASDPIPVGGEPIDPTYFMQGWLVGRRIAAMRGKKT